MFATLLGRLRFVAILEGISYLLIFAVGMPMKYFLDIPMPNKVIGMTHGVLLIIYVILTIQAKKKFNWTDRKTVLALIASSCRSVLFGRNRSCLDKETVNNRQSSSPAFNPCL